MIESPNRNHFKKALSLIIPIAAVFFFAIAANSQWDSIQAITFLPNVQLIFLSLPLLVLIFFLDAMGWHMIIRGMDAKITMGNSIRVWLISAFARYIPGIVWTYVSRIQLSNAYGVSTRITLSSIMVENIMLAFSALLCGLPVLYGVLTPVQFIILVLTITTSIIYFSNHRNLRNAVKLIPIPNKIKELINSAVIPNRTQFFFLSTYYLFFWLFFSVIFLIFSAALINTTHYNNYQLVMIACTFPLSFMLGFVVSITPGGIGIREGAMYFLLSLYITPSEALVLSICSRAWLVTGETLSAIVLVIFFKPALHQ